MAPRSTQAARQSQELREAERVERELNDDVNEAIARTDSEVFTEALGDEPIGEDTDTSLEEMGEGLEGDELEDEEAEQPEGDETGEQQQQPVEGEDGEVRQPLRTGEEQPRHDQQPQQPSIPPRVLRETRERFREAEGALQQQISGLLEQNRQLMQQLSQPQRPQPQLQRQEPQRPETPPDMFADPDGYREWVERRAEERAVARADERLTAFEQRQRQGEEQRLNSSLEAVATGPRSYEFNVAYRDLMGLDKTPQNAALVRRLIAQPDPGGAILGWWEQSSNPEYVAYHRNQVAQAYGGYAGDGQRQPGFNGGGRRQTQPQPSVRHEVRLPPSLNEASGGRSQHTIDPAMFDSSESSVFDYGSRR